MEQIDRSYLNMKCRMLGRCFVEAQRAGYDMDVFVDAFMQSYTAELLDEMYCPQDGNSIFFWMDEFSEMTGIKPCGMAPKYNENLLDWVGWTYRWWNQMRYESSKEIQKQAPFADMVDYYPFHVMSFDLAIDRIKECIEQ